jgi:HlyD family secretion protein
MEKKEHLFQKITGKIKTDFAKHRVRSIILSVVGVIVIAGLVVLFMPTSSQTNASTTAVTTGNIVTSISATGTVRASQTVTLSWQTTGEIGTVAVKVGDKVTKGATLASLVTSTLPQDIILAQSDLVAAQQNLENIKNSYVVTAKAQLALANARADLISAQSGYSATGWNRCTSDQIDQDNATLVLKKQAYEKAQASFDKVSSLATDNQDYIQAAAQLATAHQAYASAQADLEYCEGHFSDSEVSVSQAQLAVAQAAYDDAEREWERVKNGPTDADIAAAQAKVDSAQAMLDEANLTAPFDGTVTEVYATEGDQVSNTGTEAIRLDDLSKYLIDISISEMDISSIQVGQKVTVSFDAISNKTYTGSVISVSQAGTVSQSTTYFTVTVELSDADSSVLPGMTASLGIISNEADNVLLVPTTAIKSSFNSKSVYVLRNGSFVSVTVTTGSVSGSDTQVEASSLKVGDLVATDASSLSATSSLFQSLLGGAGGALGGTTGGGPSGGGEPPSGGGAPSGSGGGSPPSGGPGG